MGQSHESGGHYAEDAALVRRSPVWSFFERPFVEAARDRHNRAMGGQRGSAGRSQGSTASGPVAREWMDDEPGCRTEGSSIYRPGCALQERD